MPPPNPSRAQTNVGPLATEEGRLSFPHLKEPETTGQFPSGKFVATIIIPKTANFEPLKQAVLKSCQLSWPNLNITSLGQVKIPFRDGDEKDLDGYAGSIYIKCKTKNRPAVVGMNPKVAYDGPIKAGDFVKFSVTASAFKQNVEPEVAAALKAAGKLIVDGRDENNRPQSWRPAATFFLNAVQFRREGPAMSGGGDSAAVFEGTEPEAVADDALFR